MKTLTKLSSAALLCCASSVASAAMITDWDYVNEAGFSAWTSTSGHPDAITATGTANTVLAGTYTSLAWGNPRTALGQSSIWVDSPITGSVETNGSFVDGTDIYHDNYRITDGLGKLTGATMLDALVLTPTAVEGTPFALPAITAPVITFDILFFETSNGLETCPNGQPNYTGVNVNGCADIFTIDTATPGVTFSMDGSDLVFTNSFAFDVDGLDEYIYTLTTRLSGVEFISGAACAAVGAEEDCTGFVTTEEESNRLAASYSISAALRPAPEPSTIALFGLALLGFGFLRRKA